ncbi:dTDP-4-dehydrorhamnose 3,5-epimerase family protein [Luminiphilus sp.]|nr:dTDP-4-dehydrorhamnose 3,5-epimerase family protein [Luminiphilus sp.]
MSKFTLEQTPIAGLQIMQRRPMGDERGYLERLFCVSDLEPLIGDRTIVQINHTLTVQIGVVRGMHYQNPPYAEMKLVSCLKGEVYDVAVDLRKDSPTFLEWHAAILSEKNHRSFAIPEGFAHGFQTLADHCELIYLHTAAYAPEAEAGVDALDPLVGIEWPLPITERSVRDQAHTKINVEFVGLSV